MTTLRTMLLVTALFVAVLATAEPARQKKGSPTPPPAAPTTRGPNQPGAHGPATHGATQPVRPGAQPAQPVGRQPQFGGQPTWQGGRTNPTWGASQPGKRAGTPGAFQNAPQHGFTVPTVGSPGWGQPAPRVPAGRQQAPGNRPGNMNPPAPPQGRGQPPVHDERAQPGRPGGPGGPGHGYAPPAPPQRYDDRDEWGRGNRAWNRDRDDRAWKYVPLVTMLIRAFLPSDPKVLGAAIVGYDDTFLGFINRDANDSDSVGNGWGRFGSPLSPYSIWNPDGRWGSRYAPDSPWNPYAAQPPRVFDGDEFRGYLTTNTNLHPRIDPEWLRSYLDLPRR